MRIIACQSSNVESRPDTINKQTNQSCKLSELEYEFLKKFLSDCDVGSIPGLAIYNGYQVQQTAA